MVHDTHSCSQHCLVLEQVGGPPIVLLWPSPAPDSNCVATNRRHLRAASYLGPRPRSVHRLGHQHARACDRYCESVLYSATYDMQLRSVRRCLSDQALLTLIRAVVVSKVDYCSVLVSISGHLTDRRQSLLNTATRLVFSARRS